MKYIIIFIIFIIFISLGFAFVGMIKGGKDGSNTIFKSLTTRIGLSIFLFILLIFSGFMNWIEPNIVILDQ